MRTIIADSKLYSEQTLQVLQSTQLNWICRVPATLDAVKALLQQIRPDSLTALEQQGYNSACYTFDYGGVDQYWVVYHSSAAAQREGKTLQRRQEKEAEQARKSLNKLLRQAFHCQEDAQQAAHKWQQQWKWHQLSEVKIKEVKKYDQPGRPTASNLPRIQFTVKAQLLVKQGQWEDEL